MKEQNFNAADDFEKLSHSLDVLVNLARQYKEQNFPENGKIFLHKQMDELFHIANNIGGKVDIHAEALKEELNKLINAPGERTFQDFMDKCLTLKNDLWAL